MWGRFVWHHVAGTFLLGINRKFCPRNGTTISFEAIVVPNITLTTECAKFLIVKKKEVAMGINPM
ncbi:MAG: hypothetical protein COA82_08760 [Alkaliphilus sp.]|nr:MAG: hypothetical protein COA82_08760 [Alkaliphilus sp.]